MAPAGSRTRAIIQNETGGLRTSYVGNWQTLRQIGRSRNRFLQEYGARYAEQRLKPAATRLPTAGQRIESLQITIAGCEAR